MPLYDQRCSSCGVHEALCASSERHVCQICMGACAIIPPLVHTHGIVWSNAETSSQLGVTWNTNAEKRAWMKKHPNVKPVVKGSQDDKNFSATLKDKSDKVVKNLGFKNKEHFQKERKREKLLTTT